MAFTTLSIPISICEPKLEIRLLRMKYTAMEGMATTRPAAVVIRAFEMESDNMEAPPSSPNKATSPKASIIPTIVPNNPNKGDKDEMTVSG